MINFNPKSGFFRRCLLVQIFVFFSFLFLSDAPDAWAAHFRGGSIHTQHIGKRKIKIIFEAFFERNYTSFKCPANKTCVGTTINVGTIYTGNGGKINADMKVYFDDKPNNVIGVQAVYEYTYPGAAKGPFTVYWQSCCWIGSVKGPKKDDWRLEVKVLPDGNSSPIFNSPSFFEWCTTSPFFSAINAVDPDKDKISYKLLDFPESPSRKKVLGEGDSTPQTNAQPMTINQKGIISWPKPLAGRWVVSIVVADAKGATSYRDFLLQIPKSCTNKIPVIKMNPPQIQVKPNNQACSTLDLSDPDVNDKLELFINPQKTGASKPPQGKLTNPYKYRYCWTPKQSDLGSTYNILFTVRDSGKPNLITQATLPIEVVSGFPPIITVSPKGDTKVIERGKVLKFSVSTKDPDQNGIDTFTSTAGPGFCKITKISTTQFDVECKPSFKDGTGKHKIFFDARDKDVPKRTARKEVIVEITSGNRAPIVKLIDQVFLTRVLNKAKVQASDPDGDPIVYGMSGLPANASIDSKTGEITWTPTKQDIGDYTVQVKVDDNKGASTNIRAKLKVKEGNIAPAITSQPSKYAYAGLEMTYLAQAKDPNANDTLTWSLKSAPSSANIDSSTGQLNWKPSQVDVGKEIPFSIEVCDDGQPKECAVQGFKLKVFQACLVDKDCRAGRICSLTTEHSPIWICIAAGCLGKRSSCKSQRPLCVNGDCLPDKCDKKSCASGEACRPTDGKCIKPCQGISCSSGEQCLDGTCQKTACASKSCRSSQVCNDNLTGGAKCVANPCTEKDSCRYGRTCFRGRCIDDICSRMTCPDGKQRCLGGQCVDRKPCKGDSNCPSEQLCLNQKCYEPTCYKKPCPTGKLCLRGQCSDDPCKSKSCQERQICRPVDVSCIALCPKCSKDEVCVKGVCKADPCLNVNCKKGKRCVSGKCSSDDCFGSNAPNCKLKRVCREGQCSDPLCTGMKCPEGYLCKVGVCHAKYPPEPTDAGEPVPDPIPDPTIPLVGGGCLCSANGQPSEPALWALLLFFALLFSRRQKAS